MFADVIQFFLYIHQSYTTPEDVHGIRGGTTTGTASTTATLNAGISGVSGISEGLIETEL